MLSNQKRERFAAQFIKLIKLLRIVRLKKFLNNTQKTDKDDKQRRLSNSSKLDNSFVYLALIMLVLIYVIHFNACLLIGVANKYGILSKEDIFKDDNNWI
jgi:hypothetical protein